MTKYRVVTVETMHEVWEIEADSEDEAEEIALNGPHGVTAKVVAQPEGDLWVDSIEEIENDE